MPVSVLGVFQRAALSSCLALPVSEVFSHRRADFLASATSGVGRGVGEENVLGGQGEELTSLGAVIAGAPHLRTQATASPPLAVLITAAFSLWTPITATSSLGTLITTYVLPREASHVLILNFMGFG